MRQCKNCSRMVLSVVIVISLLLVSIIPQIVEVRSEGKHKLIWKKNLDGEVWGVCWSPDGERIVAVGDFNKVVVFDREGNKIWENKLGYYTDDSSISPDRKYLAVQVGPYDLYFYDMETGEVTYKTNTSKKELHVICSTCWSSSGGYIAVGCDWGYLYLYRWLGEKATHEWTKKMAEDCIYCVCFWPGRDDRIAIGSLDDHVYLVDLDGNVLWKTKLDSDVLDVYFAPDEDCNVAVITKSSLYILRADSGKVVFKDKLTTEHILTSIVLYDRYIMVSDDRGIIYIYEWDGEKIEPIYKFQATEEAIPFGYGLSFNPKYNLLAVASWDCHVYVYDLSEVVKTTSTPAKMTTITLISTKTTIYTAKETITVTKTKTLIQVETITLRETVTKPYTITKVRTLTATVTKQILVTIRSIITSIIETPPKISNEALIAFMVIIVIGLAISLTIRKRG